MKLKAKEAKNVGEILDLLPTFRSLVDTYETTELSGAGDRAPETSRDAVHTASAENGTEFSRLAVGLVVRQVNHVFKRDFVRALAFCCAQAQKKTFPVEIFRKKYINTQNEAMPVLEVLTEKPIGVVEAGRTP